MKPYTDIGELKERGVLKQFCELRGWDYEDVKTNLKDNFELRLDFDEAITLGYDS